MPMPKTLTSWITLRRHDLGSTFSRLVWTVACFAVATWAIVSVTINDAVMRDENADLGWTIGITSRILSDEDAQVLEDILASATPDWGVVYTDFLGDVSYASSDSAVIDRRVDPFGRPATIRLFSIASASGSQAANPSIPWFSEDMLVEGTLTAADPLVIDAKSAKRLGVSVGSRLHFEADAPVRDPEGGITDSALTCSYDKVVTAIVRPTYLFEGIFANMPELAEAYLSLSANSRGLAYIYGPTAADAPTLTDLLNQPEYSLGAALATSSSIKSPGLLISYVVRNSTRAQHYALAGAALVLVMLIALADARSMGRRLTARAQAIGARPRASVLACLLEAACVIAASGIASYWIARLTVMPKYASYEWVFGSTVATPLLICAGVAAVAMAGRLAILTLCSRSVKRG